MNEPKIYARIFVNFVLTVAGILLVVLLGPKLLRFFMPFVIAFIISSIANPIVRFMEKKIKISRKFSSVFMIVLVLCNLTEYLTKRTFQRETIREEVGNDGKPREIKGFGEFHREKMKHL